MVFRKGYDISNNSAEINPQRTIDVDTTEEPLRYLKNLSSYIKPHPLYQTRLYLTFEVVSPSGAT